MNIERVKYLHDQYLKDELSPLERKEWCEILLDSEYEPALKALLSEIWEGMTPSDRIQMKAGKADFMYEQIVSVPQRRKKIISVWRQIAAVASIFVVGILGLVYVYQKNIHGSGDDEVIQEILPGGSKATLTLADGRVIHLSESQNGIIIGDEILYSDGSEVAGLGRANDFDITDKVSNIVINTPKGGVYQVHLSDGTTVWLNSESSLTYSRRFLGQKERRVQLVGEAFFDVARDVQHPFVVESNHQKVRVLGTEFNVQAYASEKVVRTTLVEGSVEIVTPQNKTIKLLPGEQSVWNQKELRKSEVDLEAIIAWKDGYFKLEGELKDIMMQIARWYDVEILFDKDVDQQVELMGRISRDKKLNDILRMIREIDPQLTFKIEGRRVIVMR